MQAPEFPQHPVRIVVLDRDTLPPDIPFRRPAFPHHLEEFPSSSEGEAAVRIAEADVVITNKVPLRADLLAHAPRLRLIAVAATGYDVVDLRACTARGIRVCNVRGYAVRSVPEHTFALILALRRNLFAYRASVADGAWQRAPQFCYFEGTIQDLAGSTLGIIGHGALGQAVAAIGRAFGMNVLVAARRGESGGPRTPFDEVLRHSDVISLHAPLTAETRGMIGPREFALMERRPLVINTGRGGLVDEHALVAALTSGRIAGAGFDVASTEPPPADHPFMAVIGRADFILTPHVAWASTQAIRTLADQVIDNIERFIAGEPVDFVA
ncbi:D-2-hydroxyacid dehydrogenase [Chelatococcus reniformis]|uniref:Glycerate dehydrogenase n=1 Tax=Chelatococcus reniformis TaxID=1494448 RepID=A0A916UUB4_9HYPH|nr:D-2-hydroxyacid dehydrogenase [Chelatococcus reniformis]GGC88256.1 glycerate dehydrogenase [Chelatococcus reniformis]